MDRPTSTQLPTRLVDAQGFSWRRMAGDAEERYAAYNDFPAERLTYGQLASTRGPVRRVAPPQSEDVRLVRGALMMAGQQAMTTLAVALLHGFQTGERHTGHPGALIAGRPGSSESQAVRSLAWDIGPDVAPTRVHDAALEVLDGVLTEWVTGDVVVEVAETLANILGQVVMQNGGGFEKVADAPLQRAPHANRYANYATARTR
ncbi:hypothetical protein OG883_44480 [Streptomyces sp. NBC_01142]|uniref:hypothetical protein n=1 Tax=Streptomyces sp. NBC_01142 TaxID=2975865 RepID=UPI002253A52E|nr:hypothetical protein [Streptomyces sp. NBC_01142]MCX4826702.1 hypothetical protein [Streptomyces sp. NBC_01142]